MEKPIYENAHSHLTFGSNDVELGGDSQNQISLILPVFKKDGICYQDPSPSSGLLLKAATSYNERNKRHMCFSVKTSLAEINQITIRCRGFFSEDLIQNLPECPHLRLRVGMTLTLIPLRKGKGTYCEVVDTCVISQEMNISSLRTFTRKMQAGDEEPFLERTFEDYDCGFIVANYGSGGYWLSGTLKVTFCSDEDRARQASICDTIKEPSCHSDFTIVASDGAEFPCHKHFLGAHSTVLSTMIQSGLEESKSAKMIMEDMSEEGVAAFLEYLYERDVKHAWKSSQIALELFQAGHKYNIAELESKMKALFLQKSIDWFTGEVALGLFAFVRNLENYEDMKEKAVQMVVQLGSKEMLEFKSLAELFNVNEAGMEFITAILKNLKTT